MLVSHLPDIEIMCGHQSISVRLPKMTKHKCTCSVDMTDQPCMNAISLSLVHAISDYMGSNQPISFFLSFIYA